MLFDAHVHVDAFKDAWPGALAEIRADGIVTLAVSMDVPSYLASKELCAQDPRLIPAFGIHPWEAPRWHRRLDEIGPLVAEAPMLGEVGLDRRFVKDETAYGPQEEVFAWFLDAARATGKLLNLHTSGAEARVAELLEAHDPPHAMIHWYNGPMGALTRMADRGAYFSVGVEILSSDRIRKVARRVPLDRLVSETDNPGGWAWLEDEPGMPRLIHRVVEALASLHGRTPGEMEALLEENARRLLADAGVPWPEVVPHVT